MSISPKELAEAVQARINTEGLKTKPSPWMKSNAKSSGRKMHVNNPDFHSSFAQFAGIPAENKRGDWESRAPERIPGLREASTRDRQMRPENEIGERCMGTRDAGLGDDSIFASIRHSDCAAPSPRQSMTIFRDLSLVAALIATYPFAVAARSPS